MSVVEGSTLWGQIILRQASRELGASSARGAAFFAGHGDRVAARWLAFCEAAGAHCATELRVEEAVSAAQATVLAFERWLGEAGHRETS